MNNFKINENALKNDAGNAILEINNNIDHNKIGIAIKDNIACLGMKMTCASKTLEFFYPKYDATIINKLKANNFDIVCKTNLDEFANGSTGKTSNFGAVKHPFLENCSPGGSSSGSAYVVAKKLVAISIGTDTGGSIRQPAALCGIYGIKPTYGLISRFGVMSLASSLDVVGVMGQNPRDIAKVIDVISGNDLKDQTSSDVENYSASNLLDEMDITKLKVGYLSNWVEMEGVSPGVKNKMSSKIEELKKMGVTIEEIEIDYTDISYLLYIAIAYSELSINLARIDGIKYGLSNDMDDGDVFLNSRMNFGEEVKRRIIIGTYMLKGKNKEKYYNKAKKIRYKLTESIIEKFKKYDLLISPMTPTEKLEVNIDITSREGCLADQFASPFNMSGHPAMSVPIGTVDDVPVGMQIIGDYFNEAKILAFAEEIR